MKFNLIIGYKDIDGKWKEEYSKDFKDASEVDEYGKALVKNFNRALREGERERIYIGFEILDLNSNEHCWKKTNIHTVITSLGNYDIMVCKKCGVTGKRFGLNNLTKIDSKYRAKKYRNCNWKTQERNQ